MGITASPSLTVSRKHPKMDIESVMDHFEYCVNLVGIDHVSFGLDILYGDHVGIHDVLFTGAAIGFEDVTCDSVTKEKPARVEYVKGMENPTEGYNNAVRWLVKHEYSDDEIGKIIGGNVLRVLKEVWY